MIDYIQLMSSGKETAEQNRTQEVATITRELKIMAKELNVPVIALSQLRRMQNAGDPSAFRFARVRRDRAGRGYCYVHQPSRRQRHRRRYLKEKH